MEILRVHTPGKLMLAGEYGVLAPGGLAVSLAVARTLSVAVSPSDQPALTSAQLGVERLPLAGDGPTGATVVDAAIAAVRVAIATRGITERPLHYVITSELSAPGSPKGGLGSSAAVTCGLIGAFLAAHGVPLDPPPGERDELLGLALAAHLTAQGFRGSGYDIATCRTGGVVLVRTPQTTSLVDVARLALGERRDWTAGAEALADACQVESLSPPDGLHLAAVASGESASTPGLISRAKRAPSEPLRAAAQDVAAALPRGAAATLSAVAAAQDAFERWSAVNDLGLMTPPLSALADDARAAGLVPRVSGAGGGDSLLILSDDAARLDTRCNRWRDRGHEVWRVRLSARGVSVSRP